MEGLIGSVVNTYLGRRGAYLPPDLREDLDAYLLGETWRLYKRFDPSKASTPLSLSTFLTRRLQWAVTNWFRETFTDNRYRTNLLVKEVVALDEAENEPAAEEDVSILACLSHTGRERFERFGIRVAFGESRAQIASRYAMSVYDVGQEVEALGQELRSLR